MAPAADWHLFVMFFPVPNIHIFLPGGGGSHLDYCASVGGEYFLLPEIRQSVRHRGSLEREFFSRLEALTLFAAATTH